VVEITFDIRELVSRDTKFESMNYSIFADYQSISIVDKIYIKKYDENPTSISTNNEKNIFYMNLPLNGVIMSRTNGKQFLSETHKVNIKFKIPDSCANCSVKIKIRVVGSENRYIEKESKCIDYVNVNFIPITIYDLIDANNITNSLVNSFTKTSSASNVLLKNKNSILICSDSKNIIKCKLKAIVPNIYCDKFHVIVAQYSDSSISSDDDNNMFYSDDRGENAEYFEAPSNSITIDTKCMKYGSDEYYIEFENMLYESIYKLKFAIDINGDGKIEEDEIISNNKNKITYPEFIHPEKIYNNTMSCEYGKKYVGLLCVSYGNYENKIKALKLELYVPYISIPDRAVSFEIPLANMNRNLFVGNDNVVENTIISREPYNILDNYSISLKLGTDSSSDGLTSLKIIDLSNTNYNNSICKTDAFVSFIKMQINSRTIQENDVVSYIYIGEAGISILHSDSYIYWQNVNDDMNKAYGGVALHNILIEYTTGKYINDDNYIKYVKVTGQFDDVYDFDYQPSNVARIGAIVQSGYANNKKIGEIFKTICNMSYTYSDMEIMKLNNAK